MAHKFPAADYGAKHGTNAIMAVVPVRLDSFNPTLETLTAGLLATLNFEYPSDLVQPGRAITQSDTSGMELTAERTVEGQKFLYHFRVLKNKRCGYLLAGWINKAAISRVAILDQALTGLQCPHNLPLIPRISPKARGAAD